MLTGDEDDGDEREKERLMDSILQKPVSVISSQTFSAIGSPVLL